MITIALVCEGGTDQRFLEWLLDGHYEGKIVANSVQPTLDETDKNRQGNFGGWENVFDFLENPESIDNVFATNDYLIIQIDTDVCDHIKFGVSKTSTNGEKSSQELIDDVKAKLIEKMGPEKFNTYKEKISFAICIHSLECWILPMYALKKSDFSAIVNCEEKLKVGLAAQRKKYSKDSPFYKKATKPIRDRKNITLCCDSSDSFKVFIDSLPII